MKRGRKRTRFHFAAAALRIEKKEPVEKSDFIGRADASVKILKVRATAQGNVLAIVDMLAVDNCQDRKSTRLNSSHGYISYAVFCLKKKKQRPASSRTTVSSDHPPRPRPDSSRLPLARSACSTSRAAR